MKEFPTTKKVKDIQAFIDLAGYYRRFIANFPKIAKPLKINKEIGRIRTDHRAMKRIRNVKGKINNGASA